MLFVAYCFTLQYSTLLTVSTAKENSVMTAITPDQMTLSVYHTINKQSTRQYHTNQAGEAVTDCEKESVWLWLLSFTIQLLRCVDTRTVYITACTVTQSRVIEGPHQ